MHEMLVHVYEDACVMVVHVCGDENTAMCVRSACERCMKGM